MTSPGVQPGLEDVPTRAFEHLVIDVYGLPAAQGSKRHVGNGVMIESSKHVAPWRQDVKHAARDVLDDQGEWETLGCAISVVALFYFPRPKAHFRTGANAHLLREGAPRRFVAKRPDIDKVVRATFDAITQAGVWADDALVAHLMVDKVYADARPPGARLVIREV